MSTNNRKQVAADIPERLLTIKQAASLLNVSERTVRGILQVGDIPRVRVSRNCVRIRPEDLSEYIEKRTVKARTQRRRRA